MRTTACRGIYITDVQKFRFVRIVRCVFKPSTLRFFAFFAEERQSFNGKRRLPLIKLRTYFHAHEMT